MRRRFGKPLGETCGAGEVVPLEFAEPARVEHVVTMEDITQGERVTGYRVQARVGGDWVDVAQGTAFGHKKIDRIEPVVADAVRLEVTEAADTPQIRSFAVHQSPSS